MASNRGWRPDWQKSTYLFLYARIFATGHPLLSIQNFPPLSVRAPPSEGSRGSLAKFSPCTGLKGGNCCELTHGWCLSSNAHVPFLYARIFATGHPLLSIQNFPPLSVRPSLGGLPRLTRRAPAAHLLIATRLEALATAGADFSPLSGREWANVIHQYRHCERGAFMRRTRQSSGGQRCGELAGWVCPAERGQIWQSHICWIVC